jgi:hypothetical protein
MDRPKAAFSFRQMEEETLEEAKEWGRRRLQDKLNKLVEEQGAISPPERPAAEPGAVAQAEVSKRQRRNRR